MNIYIPRIEAIYQVLKKNVSEERFKELVISQSIDYNRYIVLGHKKEVLIVSKSSLMEGERA